jgi:hypothetical protein
MVRELSLGGAIIEEAYPEVAVNTPLTLVIDGIPIELKGSLARKDDGTTLVKFDLSEEARKFVSELVSGRRAA